MRALLALLVVAAIVVAGCDSDEGEPQPRAVDRYDAAALADLVNDLFAAIEAGEGEQACA